MLHYGTGTHPLQFAAGSTQTILTASGWQVSGIASHLITITSQNSTSTHTLSCASGKVSAKYLNIQHSVATGGAAFYAGANSTNNNSVTAAGSGWIFTAPTTNNFKLDYNLKVSQKLYIQ